MIPQGVLPPGLLVCSGKCPEGDVTTFVSLELRRLREERDRDDEMRFRAIPALKAKLVIIIKDQMRSSNCSLYPCVSDVLWEFSPLREIFDHTCLKTVAVSHRLNR